MPQAFSHQPSFEKSISAHPEVPGWANIDFSTGAGRISAGVS
ncbi:hypothetical protein [Pengzhenrongella sp.]|jgi:hypothetical protein